MKKFRIIVPFVLISSVLINLIFYLINYTEDIKNQKSIIKRQIEEIANTFEKVGLNFENDINYVLYSDELLQIFKSEKNSDVLINLKLFYSKYQTFITNITVYDNKQNVFSIYKDKADKFLIDTYTAREQTELFSKDNLYSLNQQKVFVIPIFKNNELVGNILIFVDEAKLFSSQLHEFNYNVNDWNCVMNVDGNSVYSSNVQFRFDSAYFHNSGIINLIKDSKESDLESVVIRNNNKSKYLSFYYPFNFLKVQYALIYNYDYKSIALIKAYKSLIITVLNVLLIHIVFLFYYKLIIGKNKEENLLKESEEAFKQILESMPIGIILIDTYKKIISINKSAIKILLIDENENLIGEDISHRFFLGKTLLMDSEVASAFESDHFIHYEKDGNEIVIYKKDIPLVLKGKDIIVQSFIDVTPIERSRKREMAANMAKSEFLAKMSHEIRTPMNGIIGMADALSQHNLQPEQAEQVNIIKRSADLLLNILNDILDLSKIEAGKMALEEIPFKLREEIKLSVDLFRNAVEDKGVLLTTMVDEKVPNNIIGDPFRIRQILINLIGNAIKFTIEGEIRVSVKMIEEYNRNLTIEFAVDDTGIGIPKDKIAAIFQSFTQADNSTTRKYGGTGLGTAISKQLVELMNGEIHAESPSKISSNPKNPGSRFVFTIELYSNEKLNKNLENEKIQSFNQIKTLIIGENKLEEKAIEEALKLFNIPNEQHIYQKGTIDFLRANLSGDSSDQYKLLVIKDSLTFDGFKFIARMNDAKLINSFTILIVSSNDKNGNYVKIKKLGIDYYLIFPFETSEVYNFICETFTSINFEEEKGNFKIQTMRPGLKILVAEDNVINQKVAKTLFKNIGYEVDFAKNGLEVLDKLRTDIFDIIFMDIMMPEMDGIQATIELRNKGYEIPVIAMTANISKEEKNAAIASGMNDYVTKPVRIDTVKKILIKLFSEEISR